MPLASLPSRLLVCALLASPFVAATARAEEISYTNDVQPILSRRCFPCHGFDPSTRKAGLRLDTREGATASLRRGAAIVPGDPDASRALERVRATDPEDRMPPAEHPALTAAEIETLERWVLQGAPYEQHWSWLPLESPDPPKVTQTEWPLDPIDVFVLARLEDAGLAPAADADRQTWLRRVTFDITGLPSTVEEQRAFLEDRNPGAYARVVDRLLASPHYAERWARHWLDLVRYAETYGHEFDYPIPHANEYRNYVIRAIEADVPYDDFVTEHLAGDLLPEPRREAGTGFNESIVATGFWFLHQGTHAPVDVRQDELERLDNQIDVFSKTFLATTVACARCHDHKFDAIPTTDYYATAAFLQSSYQREVPLLPASAAPRLAELEALHQTVAERLRAIDPESVGRRLTRDLLAAHDAVFGDPARAPAVRPTILFEDFESGSYDGWTIEGTAFGPAPQSRKTLGRWQDVTDEVGTYFLNTHEARGAGGGGSREADQHVGRAVSRPFVIERSHLRFRISGGRHPGRTELRLRVDDRAVRTATGHNSNRMVVTELDVAEFEGRKARIEIVDRETGGWGHIGVDHIEFVDRRAPLASIDLSDVEEPERVRRTLEWFDSAEFRDPNHSLARWHEAVTGVDADGGVASSATTRELTSVEASPSSRRVPPAAAVTFQTFDGPHDSWFRTGDAFGPPTTSPNWEPSPHGAVLLPTGVVSSGSLASPLRGTLRSPTFEWEHSRIYYRVSGRGRIRVIVEGYTLDRFNPLLFVDVSIDVDTGGEWRWIEQAGDLEDHRGHRVAIEIIDDGNDAIRVDEIRFGDAPLRLEAKPAAADAIAIAAADSVESLARAYGHATSNAIRSWQAGTAAPSELKLLADLMRADQLDLGAALSATITRANKTAQSLPAPRTVLAIGDGSPEEQPVYVRGDHRKLGEITPRRFLTAFDPRPIVGPTGSGRLEWARRVLAPSNPLPARVQVNRVWHHLFGRGLVGNTDDFGVLGDRPSHPELLDHLASWFQSDGRWSNRALIRRLVLSRTYRLDSRAVDSDLSARHDPNGALLSSARRRRLDGESIRDAMLALSGRLNRERFDGSVPLHLTPFLTGRGRPGQSGPLDGDGRRSLYLEVRRNFPTPMMTAFDTPNPMTTVGCRNTSNVPAQALILMNSPLVHQQAKRWAERILAERPDATVEERVTTMILEALGRRPRPEETELCLRFLSSDGAPQDEVERWAELAHVIFNLKEFIYLR